METVDVFKTRNIRITPQRIGIYEVLKGAKTHLTAEEIYEKITSKFPALSLATVYSVLATLREKNLVREIRIKPEKSYFDLRVDGHHHFLCRICGKIYDVDIPFCDVLKKKRVGEFIIEEFQGYFYGVCKECRDENNDAGDREFKRRGR